MALDTTVAGASADSYVSVSDADDFVTYKQSDTWDNASTALKEAALKAARRALDALYWKRPRATDDQALRLPSAQMKLDDGSLYLPDEVQEAQALLGLALIEDPDLLSGTGAVESVSVSGAFSIKSRTAGVEGDELPAEVYRLIDRWLYKWGPDVTTWNSAARTWD